MAGINKVMLVGFLDKDPELLFLNEREAVLNFSLATTETIEKNGTYIEQTDWHNIVMSGNMAEHAAEMLYKGRMIYIEGKVRTRSFNDIANKKKYITEIIAYNFKVIGRAGDFQIALAETGYSTKRTNRRRI